MQERVVVTGMGAVTPLGHTVADSWRNVVEGVSGVGPITLIDASEYLVQIACEVKNFNPEDYISAREARRLDRYEHMAIAAAQQAMQQSGLEISEENAGRVGIVLSTAIGGLASLQDGVATMLHQGFRRVSPFVIPMMMPNGAAGNLSIMYGARGPSYCVATACASGTDAIGTAWMMLRAGIIDAAIVGASECTVCDIGLVAFDRLGALSRQNDDYSMTPAPFDKNRDGLVMAEGAAVLILESESHARQRGAEILAEVAGHAASADAYHITAPAEDGSGSALAMKNAIQVAGVNPDEIDYINAHGTATQLNDAMETKAIKLAFGDLAYKIPISSTKSMTGHMLGATGALEAVFCIMAINNNIVPPTIHYQTPDPECDLDYIPNEAREKQVDVAVSNSFGFGGHNGVVVLRRFGNARA
ncbi:MAG: beta-ketoacyl-ACP synthase II [Anaerolineales bacterium]|jgi:3-oxoacyl-[acyl-carrier-protein] synthase II